ncbi:unnamed protein product [Brassica oleracea var. botrytis]
MVMSSIVTESESIVYWLIVHTRTEKNGQAQEGIAALRDNVDTLIVIPNDMLLTAVSLFRLLFQKHSIWQMICFVKGYRGISDNITILGLVNVDFADVRAIMANAGSSLMGVGTATDAYCYRLPLKWNQSDNVCVLVITIIIIIIFGTVVDPSFSGQVSHLLSLIFFSHMSSQNLFVNIFFLSGKYYPNSNRLQTPRRRRKEATSGDASGCINGSNKTFFFIIH